MLPTVTVGLVISTVFGEQTEVGFVIVKLGVGFIVTTTVFISKQVPTVLLI